MRRACLLALWAACAFAPPAWPQEQAPSTREPGAQEAEPPALEAPVTTVSEESVTIRLVDADLRAAVQALGRYLDRPVVFGALPDARITLETPRPVPHAEIPALLRGLLETHGLLLREEPGMYRVERAATERTPGAGGRREEQALGADDAVRLYVIRLRHARAEDVAATVNALYGRPSALGEIGLPRRPTLDQELREQRVPQADRAPSAAGAITADRVATLAGEVTIVPDPRTNSLLVRSTPGDFALIEAAVGELDIRPLQVLIEVVIAEVRRDARFAFGVDWEIPPQQLGGDAMIAAAATGLGLGDFVLTVMRLGGIDLEATLRAAASRGKVSILSRPVLLAANNESAEILVGAQRPFVQVARVLPTDAPVRDQIIQFKDVGTRLIVRPTISGDGYVMLDVVQEVNAVTSEVAFEAPVISTRTVETRLLIKDGHTAVLGGLADRQVDVTRGGIPFLSAIPLLGGLFTRTSHQTSETELFLFLTPRVIYEDEDMDQAARSARDGSRHVRRSLQKLPLVDEIEGARQGETPEPESTASVQGTEAKEGTEEAQKEAGEAVVEVVEDMGKTWEN